MYFSFLSLSQPVWGNAGFFFKPLCWLCLWHCFMPLFGWRALHFQMCCWSFGTCCWPFCCLLLSGCLLAWHWLQLQCPWQLQLVLRGSACAPWPFWTTTAKDYFYGCCFGFFQATAFSLCLSILFLPLCRLCSKPLWEASSCRNSSMPLDPKSSDNILGYPSVSKNTGEMGTVALFDAFFCMVSCFWLFSKPPWQDFCCLSCKPPMQEFPFCLFHHPPCLGFGLWLSCKPPWQDVAFLQASLLELWPLAFSQASRPGDKASKASKLLPDLAQLLQSLPPFDSIQQNCDFGTLVGSPQVMPVSGVVCVLARSLMAFFNCQGRISPLHKGSSFFALF